VRLRVHEGLALVLASPAYAVETAAARSLLPAQVSRANAVAQAAHLGALVLALERGDGSLLEEAMSDRIAEPARARLYLGHAEARRAALDAGAFGVAVSGGGPTLMALASPDLAGGVSAALESAFERAGHKSVCLITRIDSEGARLVR
jgi:homoserine kinase